jgi:hypothetical protein
MWYFLLVVFADLSGGLACLPIAELLPMPRIENVVEAQPRLSVEPRCVCSALCTCSCQRGQPCVCQQLPQAPPRSPSVPWGFNPSFTPVRPASISC